MSLNLAELLIKLLHSTGHFSSHASTETVKLRRKNKVLRDSIYSLVVNAATFMLSVSSVYLLGDTSEPAETAYPISVNPRSIFF